MSCVQIELCSYILKELYGDVIQLIGCFLLQNGPCPLILVTKGVKLKVDQVRRGLAVLLQHNLAHSIKQPNCRAEYTVDLSSVLTLPRYVHFIYATKLLCGDVAELLVETLLQHGRVETQALVTAVTQRLQQDQGTPCPSPQDMLDKLTVLVQTHFVERCLPVVAPVEAEPDEAATAAAAATRFLPPPALSSRKRKEPASGSASSRRKVARVVDSSDEEREAAPGGADGPAAEGAVWWRVNCARFAAYTRDTAVVQAAASRVDPCAGEVVRAVLRLSETRTHPEAAVTQPVSVTEIGAALPAPLAAGVLEQYLTLLAEDSTRIVVRAGDGGGGMYAVHLRRALAGLSCAHIESIVRERFGAKCARIFRLLILKQQLEQKQIEDMAMIPAKETKEMLYHMLGENFVTLTEVPRTAEYAPARTFYLFSVNQPHLARRALQRCYKTMSNLMNRRLGINDEHRRLLEKQQRVAAILQQLENSGADDAQKAELKDAVTSSERATLDAVSRATTQLELGEAELGQTIFILQTYLAYENMVV